MTTCNVPWTCRVCGATGTVPVLISKRHNKVLQLLEGTVEQHGLRDTCGLFDVFYDFPECWKEKAKAS